MRKISLIASFCFLGIATTAFSQVAGVPEIDPFSAILDLIKNWRAIGPFAIGMSVVAISVQLIKKFAPGFKYSRIAVTVLSLAYAMLFSVQAGSSWLEAGILVLITGGGAVAVYEAYKGMSKTVAAVKKRR